MPLLLLEGAAGGGHVSLGEANIGITVTIGLELLLFPLFLLTPLLPHNTLLVV